MENNQFVQNTPNTEIPADDILGWGAMAAEVAATEENNSQEILPKIRENEAFKNVVRTATIAAIANIAKIGLAGYDIADTSHFS